MTTCFFYTSWLVISICSTYVTKIMVIMQWEAWYSGFGSYLRHDGCSGCWCLEGDEAKSSRPPGLRMKHDPHIIHAALAECTLKVIPTQSNKNCPPYKRETSKSQILYFNYVFQLSRGCLWLFFLLQQCQTEKRTYIKLLLDFIGFIQSFACFFARSIM